MAQPQLEGPFPGGGRSTVRRPVAALAGSRAVKVTNLVIRHFLSTYCVPGAILRTQKQQ